MPERKVVWPISELEKSHFYEPGNRWVDKLQEIFGELDEIKTLDATQGVLSDRVCHTFDNLSVLEIERGGDVINNRNFRVYCTVYGSEIKYFDLVTVSTIEFDREQECVWFISEKEEKGIVVSSDGEMDWFEP